MRHHNLTHHVSVIDNNEMKHIFKKLPPRRSYLMLPVKDNKHLFAETLQYERLLSRFYLPSFIYFIAISDSSSPHY